MSCDFNLLRCRHHRGNFQANNRNIMLSSNAYKSLSTEEQNRINCDLYGIAEPIEETPDFVENKLEELDRELDLLSNNSTEHYYLALTMEQQSGGKEYYARAKFRLAFLRAERFDARLAAKRVTLYFKEKRDLFGEDKLAQRIRQVDLNDEERMALVSGAFNYIGTTDSFGRHIVVIRHSNFSPFSPLSVKRLLFYVFQRVLEDNETAQKKGLIGIGYNLGSSMLGLRSALGSLVPARKMAMAALPIRFMGVHFCYDDLKMHIIINLLLFAAPERYKLLFVAHYQKTHEECLLNLMKYGINEQSLPLTIEGGNRYKDICDYWETIRQQEE